MPEKKDYVEVEEGNKKVKKGAEFNASPDRNEFLSRADRLVQIAALQNKVDCLKQGNANAGDAIEQARLAKEKITTAKGVLESAVTTEAKTAALEQLRMRIAEARAIIAKAADHVENIKANCKPNGPVVGNVLPAQ